MEQRDKALGSSSQDRANTTTQTQTWNIFSQLGLGKILDEALSEGTGLLQKAFTEIGSAFTSEDHFTPEEQKKLEVALQISKSLKSENTTVADVEEEFNANKYGVNPYIYFVLACCAPANKDRYLRLAAQLNKEAHRSFYKFTKGKMRAANASELGVISEDRLETINANALFEEALQLSSDISANSLSVEEAWQRVANNPFNYLVLGCHFPKQQDEFFTKAYQLDNSVCSNFLKLAGQKSPNILKADQSNVSRIGSIIENKHLQAIKKFEFFEKALQLSSEITKGQLTLAQAEAKGVDNPYLYFVLLCHASSALDKARYLKMAYEKEQKANKVLYVTFYMLAHERMQTLFRQNNSEGIMNSSNTPKISNVVHMEQLNAVKELLLFEEAMEVSQQIQDLKQILNLAGNFGKHYAEISLSSAKELEQNAFNSTLIKEAEERAAKNHYIYLVLGSHFPESRENIFRSFICQNKKEFYQEFFKMATTRMNETASDKRHAIIMPESLEYIRKYGNFGEALEIIPRIEGNALTIEAAEQKAKETSNPYIYLVLAIYKPEQQTSYLQLAYKMDENAHIVFSSLVKTRIESMARSMREENKPEFLNKIVIGGIKLADLELIQKGIEGIRNPRLQRKGNDETSNQLQTSRGRAATLGASGTQPPRPLPRAPKPEPEQGLASSKIETVGTSAEQKELPVVKVEIAQNATGEITRPKQVDEKRVSVKERSNTFSQILEPLAPSSTQESTVTKSPALETTLARPLPPKPMMPKGQTVYGIPTKPKTASEPKQESTEATAEISPYRKDIKSRTALVGSQLEKTLAQGRPFGGGIKVAAKENNLKQPPASLSRQSVMLDVNQPSFEGYEGAISLARQFAQTNKDEAALANVNKELGNMENPYAYIAMAAFVPAERSEHYLRTAYALDPDAFIVFTKHQFKKIEERSKQANILILSKNTSSKSQEQLTTERLLDIEFLQSLVNYYSKNYETLTVTHYVYYYYSTTNPLPEVLPFIRMQKDELVSKTSEDAEKLAIKHKPNESSVKIAIFKIEVPKSALGEEVKDDSLNIATIKLRENIKPRADLIVTDLNINSRPEISFKK